MKRKKGKKEKMDVETKEKGKGAGQIMTEKEVVIKVILRR